MLPGLNEAPLLVPGLGQRNLGPVLPGRGNVVGAGATASAKLQRGKPLTLPRWYQTSWWRPLKLSILWSDCVVHEGEEAVRRMVGRTSWTHICDNYRRGWIAIPTHDNSA